MNAMKTMCLGAGMLCLIPLGGCEEKGAAGTTAVRADVRCPHEIKADTCPFCNPEMVDAEGFCGAHACPEAICAQCKPALKVAFRAQGDWCDEHRLPESQCIPCNPALAERIQEGVHGGAMPGPSAETDPAHCKHGIAQAKCPFCSPSLIDSEGFCAGHGVAEALCVRCRPFLKTAFMSKGDWCAQHSTPESQCAICNP